MRIHVAAAYDGSIVMLDRMVRKGTPQTILLQSNPQREGIADRSATNPAILFFLWM